MARFLLRQDYITQIQEAHLDQATEEQSRIIDACEQDAISEVRGYLDGRFELDNEMILMTIWSPAVSTYTSRDQVYLDADEYDSGKAYSLNALALYEGGVYINIQAGTDKIEDAAYWTLIGPQYATYYAALPADHTLYNYETIYSKGDKVFYKGKSYTAKSEHSGYKPDDSDYGTTYWTDNGAYNVDAGSLPSGSKWVSGDLRNGQLRRKTCDIAIFFILQRIAPRSISELRHDAYSRAIDWLDKMSRGSLQTTMELKQPRAEAKGLRPRFGYKQKNQNNY